MITGDRPAAAMEMAMAIARRLEVGTAKLYLTGAEVPAKRAGTGLTTRAVDTCPERTTTGQGRISTLS